MRNIFNINYSRAAVLLLPLILRKKLLTAFLSAAMRPLDGLNGEFAFFRRSVDASSHSQTCRLRSLLNDYFDYYERRIYIRPAPLDKDYYLLWEEGAAKPVVLESEARAGDRQPYLAERDGQIGSGNTDFEIVLPAGYRLSNNDKNQLAALVDGHRLASKKYVITNG